MAIFALAHEMVTIEGLVTKGAYCQEVCSTLFFFFFNIYIYFKVY